MKRFSRHSFGVRNRAPGLMTLFPALLLLLALGNRIAAGNQMLSHVVQVYPGSSKFLRETIQSLSGISTGIIISCGVIVMWAGSWVFAVVERALNRIWGTMPRTFLHGRALTLGMIGIVGLLLSVSVLVTSVLLALQEIADRLSPRQLENYRFLSSVGSVFWQIVFALVSLLVTFTLFAIVYKFMPNARVTVSDVIPGAVIAGLLWEGAKYVFAWSLNYLDYNQVYGSVGAVVAVLVWGYVSSLVLLFGAQLTSVFHREHMEQTVPQANINVPSASFS
jgi:membrane protein